jgi:hypothetical protein
VKDKDSELINDAMYPAKRRPIKYKDVEVDLVHTDNGIRVVKHGTDEDLSWRLQGIFDDEIERFRDGVWRDYELGQDIVPVKIDTVKGKGYLLHIIDER